MMARGGSARRLMDKTLGAPLLAAAGVLRRRRQWPADTRHIVVLQTPMIGDTVLLTGPLRDLRRCFPAATITLLVGRENQGIGPLIPEGIDVVGASYTSPFSTARLLRALQPDVVIDFGAWPRISALFSLFAGARFTAGFNTPGQHRHYAFDLTVEHSPALHELTNQRLLTQALTGQPSDSPPTLAFTRRALPAGLQRGRFAVLHGWASGAGKHSKQWDMLRWATVARWLNERGLAIVVTGAPQDAADAAALAATITRETGSPVVDLAGAVRLADLPSLLADAAVVISVNTGIMHLAAASGAPTIGLNGPTDPIRWGPYGAHCRSISPARGKHSFLHLGYEFPRGVHDGLTHLQPQQVIAALEDLGIGQ